MERLGIKFLATVEDGPPLPAEIRKLCLRVTREAVANAARHGKPTVVEVIVGRQSGLTLTVRDNGCGFDAASPPPADSA